MVSGGVDFVILQLVASVGDVGLLCGHCIGFPGDAGFAFGQFGFAFGEFARPCFCEFLVFGFDGMAEFDEFGAVAFEGVALGGEADGVEFALEFDPSFAFLERLALQFGEAIGVFGGRQAAITCDHAEHGGEECGGDGVFVDHGRIEWVCHV